MKCAKNLQDLRQTLSGVSCVGARFKSSLWRELAALVLLLNLCNERLHSRMVCNHAR